MQSAERYHTTTFPGTDEGIITMRWRALEIWQFINIFLLSLVTGVFWGTWLGLGRSMSSLSAATFLEVGHKMIGNLGQSWRYSCPPPCSRRCRCSTCSISDGRKDSIQRSSDSCCSYGAADHSARRSPAGFPIPRMDDGNTTGKLAAVA